MKQYKLPLFILLFYSLTSLGQWTQIGQSILGASSNDGTGVSVSLSADGSIVAVGADSNTGLGFVSSGYVRVYQNQSGNWVQIGQDLEGDGNFDQFGYAISLSADGNFIAVGADSYSPSVSVPNRGRVQVYQNQSGTWLKVGQDLEGDAAEDYFGWSVSLSEDGSRIAIGAPVNDEGYVKVYENQSGTWTQIGQKILGEAAGDQSGYAVSLSADGNILAVGADSNDGNGSGSGHVRVYENQSGNWMQIGQDIDGDASEDFFGVTLSLSANGTMFAAGAIGNDDNGNDSGHVKIYENQSGSWVQIGQDIQGEAAGDQSGFSVSLSANGNIVAIGADSNDGNGTDSGQVRVFQNQSGTWVQIGQDIDGDTASDFFGSSVSLSDNGGILAAGAPENDGNGSDSGHARLFENSSILSTENNEFTTSYPLVSRNAAIHVITEDEIELKVYNILGMQVHNKNLTSGIYIVRITNSLGHVMVRKVWVR